MRIRRHPFPESPTVVEVVSPLDSLGKEVRAHTGVRIGPDAIKFTLKKGRKEGREGERKGEFKGGKG